MSQTAIPGPGREMVLDGDLDAGVGAMGKPFA